MKDGSHRDGDGSSKLIWPLGSVISQNVSLEPVSSCGAPSGIGMDKRTYSSVATLQPDLEPVLNLV